MTEGRFVAKEGRLEQIRGQNDDDVSCCDQSEAPMTAEEFSELFRNSFRVLWLVAAGIVSDRILAEDVVQEAAIVAFQKRSQFESGTNFTAWMAQMVRFTALNHRRKERKHARPSSDSDLLENANENARSHGRPPNRTSTPQLRITSDFNLPADQAHFDDRIVTALREVADEGRACLLLRVIENLEYSEISQILDMPEGTAMSHVHRTKQFLRERLSNILPMKSNPSNPKT